MSDLIESEPHVAIELGAVFAETPVKDLMD